MTEITSFEITKDKYIYDFDIHMNVCFVDVFDKKGNVLDCFTIQGYAYCKSNILSIQYDPTSHKLTINGKKHQANTQLPPPTPDELSSYEEPVDAPELSTYQHIEKLPDWIRQKIDAPEMEEELTLDNCITKEDQQYFDIRPTITSSQYDSLRKAWFNSKKIGPQNRTSEYWKNRHAILKSLFTSQCMTDINRDKFLDGIAHNMKIDKKELLRSYKKYLHKYYPALIELLN